MSKSNKYLGKLYEFLTLLQENLILKQQKMEEISMSEVAKMWDLMGSNGETVQMDLSWVSSKEDIDNLINAIDGLKNQISEMQYGDMTSLAESCASDWYNKGQDVNDSSKLNVYGYVGNKINIIVPAKLKHGDKMYNASYEITSGGTSKDNGILGAKGTTKTIAFIGDFVDQVGYWSNIYADEFIGLDKLTKNSTKFSSNVWGNDNRLRIHSNGLKTIDFHKMSIKNYYGSSFSAPEYNIYDYYTSANPSEPFFLIQVLDTPNLETVTLPEAMRTYIDQLINEDYGLMTKMKEAFPKFKEFIYA